MTSQLQQSCLLVEVLLAHQIQHNFSSAGGSGVAETHRRDGGPQASYPCRSRCSAFFLLLHDVSFGAQEGAKENEQKIGASTNGVALMELDTFCPGSQGGISFKGIPNVDLFNSHHEALEHLKSRFKIEDVTVTAAAASTLPHQEHRVGASTPPVPTSQHQLHAPGTPTPKQQQQQHSGTPRSARGAGGQGVPYHNSTKLRIVAQFVALGGAFASSTALHLLFIEKAATFAELSSSYSSSESPDTRVPKVDHRKMTTTKLCRVESTMWYTIPFHLNATVLQDAACAAASSSDAPASITSGVGGGGGHVENGTLLDNMFISSLAHDLPTLLNHNYDCTLASAQDQLYFAVRGDGMCSSLPLEGGDGSELGTIPDLSRPWPFRSTMSQPTTNGEAGQLPASKHKNAKSQQQQGRASSYFFDDAAAFNAELNEFVWNRSLLEFVGRSDVSDWCPRLVRGACSISSSGEQAQQRAKTMRFNKNMNGAVGALSFEDEQEESVNVVASSGGDGGFIKSVTLLRKSTLSVAHHHHTHHQSNSEGAFHGDDEIELLLVDDDAEDSTTSLSPSFVMEAHHCWRVGPIPHERLLQTLQKKDLDSRGMMRDLTNEAPPAYHANAAYSVLDESPACSSNLANHFSSLFTQRYFLSGPCGDGIVPRQRVEATSSSRGLLPPLHFANVMQRQMKIGLFSTSFPSPSVEKMVTTTVADLTAAEKDLEQLEKTLPNFTSNDTLFFLRKFLMRCHLQEGDGQANVVPSTSTFGVQLEHVAQHITRHNRTPKVFAWSSATKRNHENTLRDDDLSRFFHPTSFLRESVEPFAVFDTLPVFFHPREASVAWKVENSLLQAVHMFDLLVQSPSSPAVVTTPPQTASTLFVAQRLCSIWIQLLKVELDFTPPASSSTIFQHQAGSTSEDQTTERLAILLESFLRKTSTTHNALFSKEGSAAVFKDGFDDLLAAVELAVDCCRNATSSSTMVEGKDQLAGTATSRGSGDELALSSSALQHSNTSLNAMDAQRTPTLAAQSSAGKFVSGTTPGTPKQHRTQTPLRNPTAVASFPSTPTGMGAANNTGSSHGCFPDVREQYRALSREEAHFLENMLVTPMQSNWETRSLPTLLSNCGRGAAVIKHSFQPASCETDENNHFEHLLDPLCGVVEVRGRSSSSSGCSSPGGDQSPRPTPPSSHPQTPRTPVTFAQGTAGSSDNVSAVKIIVALPQLSVISHIALVAPPPPNISPFLESARSDTNPSTQPEGFAAPLEMTILAGSSVGEQAPRVIFEDAPVPIAVRNATTPDAPSVVVYPMDNYTWTEHCPVLPFFSADPIVAKYITFVFKGNSSKLNMHLRPVFVFGWPMTSYPVESVPLVFNPNEPAAAVTAKDQAAKKTEQVDVERGNVGLTKEDMMLLGRPPSITNNTVGGFAVASPEALSAAGSPFGSHRERASASPSATSPMKRLPKSPSDSLLLAEDGCGGVTSLSPGGRTPSMGLLSNGGRSGSTLLPLMNPSTNSSFAAHKQHSDARAVSPASPSAATPRSPSLRSAFSSSKASPSSPAKTNNDSSSRHCEQQADTKKIHLTPMLLNALRKGPRAKDEVGPLLQQLHRLAEATQSNDPQNKPVARNAALMSSQTSLSSALNAVQPAPTPRAASGGGVAKAVGGGSWINTSSLQSSFVIERSLVEMLLMALTKEPELLREVDRVCRTLTMQVNSPHQQNATTSTNTAIGSANSSAGTYTMKQLVLFESQRLRDRISRIGRDRVYHRCERSVWFMNPQLNILPSPMHLQLVKEADVILGDDGTNKTSASAPKTLQQLHKAAKAKEKRQKQASAERNADMLSDDGRTMSARSFGGGISGLSSKRQSVLSVAEEEQLYGGSTSSKNTVAEKVCHACRSKFGWFGKRYECKSCFKKFCNKCMSESLKPLNNKGVFHSALQMCKKCADAVDEQGRALRDTRNKLEEHEVPELINMDKISYKKPMLLSCQERLAATPQDPSYCLTDRGQCVLVAEPLPSFVRCQDAQTGAINLARNSVEDIISTSNRFANLRCRRSRAAFSHHHAHLLRTDCELSGRGWIVCEDGSGMPQFLTNVPQQATPADLGGSSPSLPNSRSSTAGSPTQEGSTSPFLAFPTPSGQHRSSSASQSPSRMALYQPMDKVVTLRFLAPVVIEAATISFEFANNKRGCIVSTPLGSSVSMSMPSSTAGTKTVSPVTPTAAEGSYPLPPPPSSIKVRMLCGSNLDDVTPFGMAELMPETQAVTKKGSSLVEDDDGHEKQKEISVNDTASRTTSSVQLQRFNMENVGKSIKQRATTILKLHFQAPQALLSQLRVFSFRAFGVYASGITVTHPAALTHQLAFAAHPMRFYVHPPFCPLQPRAHNHNNAGGHLDNSSRMGSSVAGGGGIKNFSMVSTRTRTSNVLSPSSQRHMDVTTGILGGDVDNVSNASTVLQDHYSPLVGFSGSHPVAAKTSLTSITSNATVKNALLFELYSPSSVCGLTIENFHPVYLKDGVHVGMAQVIRIVAVSSLGEEADNICVIPLPVPLVSQKTTKVTQANAVASGGAQQASQHSGSPDDSPLNSARKTPSGRDLKNMAGSTPSGGGPPSVLRANLTPTPPAQSPVGAVSPMLLGESAGKTDMYLMGNSILGGGGSMRLPPSNGSTRVSNPVNERPPGLQHSSSGGVGGAVVTTSANYPPSMPSPSMVFAFPTSIHDISKIYVEVLRWKRTSVGALTKGGELYMGKVSLWSSADAQMRRAVASRSYVSKHSSVRRLGCPPQPGASMSPPSMTSDSFVGGGTSSHRLL